MAAVDGFLQQFAKHLQFARVVGGSTFSSFNNRKSQQTCRNRSSAVSTTMPAFRQALRTDGLQNFLAAGFDDLLINAALFRRQFAEGDLFDLGGQIGRHVFFQSPQQEGSQPPREPLLRVASLPRRWAVRSARENLWRVPR